MKMHAKSCEIIFFHHASHKRLVSRIYFLKLSKVKDRTYNPMTMGRRFENLPPKDTQWQINTPKKILTSLVTTEMQIKLKLKLKQWAATIYLLDGRNKTKEWKKPDNK